MSVINRTLAAALIAGGVSSLAGSAGAVPLSASLALRDASPPAVETVRWRGRGFGGIGFGLAAGALIGGAIASRSYYGGYGYGYGYGGYGGYGYGYPAYGYGYGPAYGYSYAPSYYGYAPAYYSYASPRYYYGGYPRLRYRSAGYLRRW
jgi:hypothetical protein